MTVTVHILQGDVHSVRLLFLRCHTGRKAGMFASQKERREGGTSVEYDLILARSVTYAQRMQRALNRAGIRSQLFRAPVT